MLTLHWLEAQQGAMGSQCVLAQMHSKQIASRAAASFMHCASWSLQPRWPGYRSASIRTHFPSCQSSSRAHRELCRLWATVAAVLLAVEDAVQGPHQLCLERGSCHSTSPGVSMLLITCKVLH